MSAASFSPRAEAARPKVVALAGNPNVGKSSLFNCLTGSRQRIANYPGVTVEKKTGLMKTSDGQEAVVVDLPGAYSLAAASEDESIAARCLLGKFPGERRPDVVLVVVEALNLSRGLLLFRQIQRMHPRAVLVLNMIDELKRSGRRVDVRRLSERLDAPVVETCARSGFGIDALVKIVAASPLLSGVPLDETGPAFAGREEIAGLFDEIDALVAEVTSGSGNRLDQAAEKLDALFLHPVGGPLIFLLVLFFVFQSLFTWSAPLTDAIDSGMNTIAAAVAREIPVAWLKSLVADGVIAGVGSVIVFVPQIAITFLLIGFLEMTGYLARGAFLMDRLMRSVGLEGRAFIPLISSFACAVPGIMAARTIPNTRQRLMTILIAPLMTCSARLPVYTLLIATFVPARNLFGYFNAQGLVLFGLFLTGVAAGLAVSFVLDRLLPGRGAGGFFIELPRYRLPAPKHLWYYVSFRTGAFLKNAGTIIFLLSVILWALAYFPRDAAVTRFYDAERDRVETSSLPQAEKEALIAAADNAEAGDMLRGSAMGRVGRALEPLLKPMGFDWRLGVAIVGSFAAREVFVSTLGIVFNVGEADETSQSLRQKLLAATVEGGKPAYTLRTALALLAFFALAAQCMSTLAVIRRETASLKWPVVVFVYMSLLAFAAGTLVYQGLGLLGMA